MEQAEFIAIVEEQTGTKITEWEKLGYKVVPCQCEDPPCPQWKLSQEAE